MKYKESEMKDNEVQIIKKMCECNMNVNSAAEKLYMHRNTVSYQLKRIKEKYGLDPRCFWDLAKLAKMVGAVPEDAECCNIDELLKLFPQEKREAIQAVLKAKSVIVIDTEKEKE